MLNCNIYDVATHAAIELKADKLIIMRHALHRKRCQVDVLYLEAAWSSFRLTTTKYWQLLQNLESNVLQ